MKKRLHQFSVIVILSGLALRGESAPLLSNLDQPGFQSPPVLGLNQFLAAPFITGSSPTVFNSATVQLGVSQLATGHVYFYLYSDASGLPASQLIGGALNGSASPKSAGTYLYSATDPILLSPNTRYWLVGSGDIGGPNFNYAWYDTSSYSYSSSVGWQLPGYDAFSSDQGATWISTADAPIPSPLMFEIEGSVVPEPATGNLLGIGLLVIAGVNRRQLNCQKQTRQSA
jgi:hypothetical protein